MDFLQKLEYSEWYCKIWLLWANVLYIYSVYHNKTPDQQNNFKTYATHVRNLIVFYLWVICGNFQGVHNVQVILSILEGEGCTEALNPVMLGQHVK